MTIFFFLIEVFYVIFKDNVKSSFVLENDFKGTTHAIWRQKPHEVADSVKRFIINYP